MPKHLPAEKAALLAQLVQDESLTVREIGVRVGVSYQTAQNWRRRHQAGKPQPTSVPRGTPPKPSEARAFIRETVGNIPAAQVLTDDQMEQILSAIAQEGQGPSQVQAIKLLEDLKDKHRPAERKGPEPPLTSEDRIVRLVRLLECLTEEEARLAFSRRYGIPLPESLPPLSPKEP